MILRERWQARAIARHKRQALIRMPQSNRTAGTEATACALFHAICNASSKQYVCTTSNIAKKSFKF